MKYDIYYQDPYQCQLTARLLPREFYTKVATVDLKSAEAVFEQMNHIDGTQLISKMYPPLRSMSVGDIVVDENGVAQMCASAGFQPVKFKP